MSHRLLLGNPGPRPGRILFLGGVALSVLTSLLSARAQQPAQQDQQAPVQEQTAPVSPPQQEQPAPQGSTSSRTQLPAIVVRAAQPKEPRPTSHKNAAGAQPRTTQPVNATTAAQAALDTKMGTLDRARDNNLLPKIGASTYTITRQAIENLPQGDNTPIDKVILQMPGVSYDSAVSNPSYHVRNEYANVQIRINGVVLPEGVSGLGPFLDTNFIGSILSSETKCNTPADLIIGTADQDLRECCHAMLYLSDDEREQIGLAKALGHSIGAIAQAIGRPKSTVWRELCRNRLPSGRYSPLHAAGAYQLRSSFGCRAR